MKPGTASPITRRCVSANQIIAVQRVKRQLADQIFHTGVKAVMARSMTVQQGVRGMMGSESGRNSRFHLRVDHINIVCVDFQVTGLDVDDAPVLPAVPLVDPLVVPNSHGPVEEQRPADEVHASEFDCTDQKEVTMKKPFLVLARQFRCF